ncbi:MAG: response regulator [Rhodospirillales bacterium]|nr:response regulator [Rhodospirillales bacterium]
MPVYANGVFVMGIAHESGLQSAQLELQRSVQENIVSGVNKATVLVVDDLVLVRELVANALANNGYMTVTAADGRQALETMAWLKPDAIVLDITMPSLDGFEFLRILRNQDATMSIPVIILTNSNKKKDVIKAAKLGVSGYMIKSQFSLENLLDKLKVVLESSPPPSEAEAELHAR